MEKFSLKPVGSLLTSPVISIGNKASAVLEFFLNKKLSSVSLHLFEKGEINVYPETDNKFPSSIDTTLENSIFSGAPAIAYLVVSSTDTESLLGINTFLTELRNNGVFVLALVCLDSYFKMPDNLEIIKAQQNFHMYADSFLFLYDQAHKSDLFEATFQIVENLNDIILDKNNSEVNIDFEDIKTVLNASLGVAGIAIAKGANRAEQVVQKAFSTPFMNDNSIISAKRALLSIQSGDTELEMEELTLITELIQDKIGNEADIIFGHGIDNSLGENIKLIVLIAGASTE